MTRRVNGWLGEESAGAEDVRQVGARELGAGVHGPGVWFSVRLFPAQVVGRQFLEKAAGFAGNPLAAALAPLDEREGERLARAGDADIGQAAFFLHARVRLALGVREEGVARAAG